ncbi:MAG: HAMP domain-containing histidine kinase [SAR324 cluster bacterium]|nr:HAMP domain-containing histidine kinase [SAR324 cluster bacterium]
MENRGLFDTELKTIKKNESITNYKQYQSTPLFKEFDELSKSYSKLFKQFSRVVKMSDMQQEKLRNAFKEIEMQKAVVEKQNDELIEASKLREDVDQIIRHNLKNPLQVIIGYPGIILKKETLTENGKTHINSIKAAGYRMLDMINLSLDLFKMERGVYQVNPVSVDVIKVLKNIEIEVEETRKTKNLTIKTKVSGCTLTQEAQENTFSILGEELLCYSMLANLIKNAIEASPEGESISINIDKNESAVISIHNKGTVPEEIRNKFFEKFTTSGKKTGTGLGTYSAKLIAETQRGKISMETSVTNGTTITIKLPDK